MGWIDGELALVTVAAMLSPTTLSFSVLALVLGDRPLRTGVWFYLGALSATLAVGVLAAFVLGNKAASTTSYPKPWVAVIDIIAAVLLVFFSVRFLSSTSPPRPNLPSMVSVMDLFSFTVATAKVVGACCALAMPAIRNNRSHRDSPSIMGSFYGSQGLQVLDNRRALFLLRYAK